MDSTAVAAILILFAVVMLVATSVAARIRARRALLRNITESWGKEPAAQYTQEDFLSIASYFKNRGKEPGAGFAVDDITWRDLDMDSVFARLNNTCSTAGEECLYRLLRELVFEPPLLAERRELIQFFQEAAADRLKIQVLLSKLGKRRFINVTDYFFARDARKPWKAAAYNVLALAAIVAPAFLFVDTALGILLMCATFLYDNIHFQEAISGEGIVFDYKVYGGRASSRNAIRLLRLMGYGDTIVNEAEEHAGHFLHQGKWHTIS